MGIIKYISTFVLCEQTWKSIYLTLTHKKKLPSTNLRDKSNLQTLSSWTSNAQCAKGRKRKALRWIRLEKKGKLSPFDNFKATLSYNRETYWCEFATALLLASVLSCGQGWWWTHRLISL